MSDNLLSPGLILFPAGDLFTPGLGTCVWTMLLQLPWGSGERPLLLQLFDLGLVIFLRTLEEHGTWRAGESSVGRRKSGFCYVLLAMFLDALGYLFMVAHACSKVGVDPSHQTAQCVVWTNLCIYKRGGRKLCLSVTWPWRSLQLNIVWYSRHLSVELLCLFWGAGVGYLNPDLYLALASTRMRGSLLAF